MKISIKKGFGFGITSGVITTLGLIVGLHSGTQSTLIIIEGILIIAIADAMSDALGVHVSEEAENQHSVREIWAATIATFLSKFIFAISFIVPMIILPLNAGIIVSIIYGLLLIAVFSFYLAKKQKTPPYKVVSEHLLIAVLVIIITHYLGDLLAGILARF